MKSLITDLNEIFEGLMEQFQVGKFDIDVSRCRISSEDYEVIVEPKVMDVLTFLFTRKRDVVSQQQIFEAVWPGATFNPSSVQRCIALLRKALQENSRNPLFIITHPKRGYSLELPVETPVDSHPDNHNVVASKTEQSAFTRFGSALAALLLVVIIAWSVFSKDSAKTDFTRLLPVSSSEENESFLSLSPNGKYLAFVRGEDEQQNIWLKVVKSGHENKLTRQVANYNVLGWSPEGNAIAFMRYDSALKKRVMAYLTLDTVALKPLQKTDIYDFPELYVNGNHLQWSRDNKIYFVEWRKEPSDTWLSYIDLADNTKHRLIQSQGQEWLLTFALHPDHQQIVLGYEIGQNRYRADLLDLNTNAVEPLATFENSIQGISWHPNGEEILVSNRNTLQLIDMGGAISEIEFDNYQFVIDAQYLPSGDEIYMELRSLDVDILRKTSTSPQQFETLVDTSAADFLPVFSPDDQRFVFESHRTGLKQLYVYEKGEQRLLFTNPDNKELFGTVWSPDGKTVFAASKESIFKIDAATGNFEEQFHGHEPFYLREHFSQDNALLVSYRAADGVTFHAAKLDLATMSLNTYAASGERLVCYSMALDTQDTIYFANSQEVFKLVENVSDNTVKPESLWRSEGPNIGGVRVKGDSISVVLHEEDSFQITNIDLKTGEQTLIHQGIEDGPMLTNSSNDETQFLYLSKFEKKGHLVRLR